jgi:hypothetical protein
VASIEQVKAELAQAAEQGAATTQQIRAAIEGTEQVLTRLRGVAAGTSHAAITEAIGRAEQSRQQLIDAATTLHGSAEAARQYISILG